MLVDEKRGKDYNSSVQADIPERFAGECREGEGMYSFNSQRSHPFCSKLLQQICVDSVFNLTLCRVVHLSTL